MNDQEKRKQLRKYKAIATGLFLLMTLIFIATTIMQKDNPSNWIGYVKAFAEAAMVGALADWFAVTALFHHPLGLPIPHTNLIQNSKEKIGDNLGNFVVDNFLAPKNIRPYIQKIKVSNFVGEWISKDKNQQIILSNASEIALNIINKLDDKSVTKFISNKIQEIGKDIPLNVLLGNGMEYILEKKDHQKIVTNLAIQIKDYVAENDGMIQDRVKKGSYSFIPKFVDDKIADKISSGIVEFFTEVGENTEHELRNVITKKLSEFATELKEDEKWKTEFQNIKTDLLKNEKLNEYANDIWVSIKTTLINELDSENSTLKLYLRRNLQELSYNLQNDEKLQIKIDGWVRLTAYKYILKNTHQAGTLISSTVGNWQGDELSKKLELEVGKDLQFIRVNGTLVGGLVGLLIYTVSHFIA